MNEKLKIKIEHYESKLSFEADSSDVWTAVDNKENVIVLDARSPKAYENEHIVNAINIHHKLMDENTTKHLDKNALIITYCDGIGCNASTKGALKMAKLGFDVKELLGGLDWWKRDGYPTHILSTNKIADPSCCI